MLSRILALLLLLAATAVADTKSEVDRLFMQASSGEVKYRDLVKPSEDSLIAMGDSAAKYLALKLKSTDARERLTLVHIYKGIGKAGTPYLLKALDTDNKDQLRATARCLAEVKDSAALPDLLHLAGNEDYTIRSEALTAIGRTGGDSQLAMDVAAFLTDSVPLVRKSCVVALGRIHADESLPDLVRALNDSYFGVRLTAYDALAKYDSLAFGDILGVIKDGDNPRTRALGVKLAGQLKMSEAADLIMPLMTDPNDLIRGWAVWSWGRIMGPESEMELTALGKQETDVFVLSQITATLEYLHAKSTDE
jgi:HEAT repeat protein